MIEKLETQIGQIEKTIETMEEALAEREFQDYCDNAYSCISYLRQSIRKVKINKRNRDLNIQENGQSEFTGI